MRKKGDQEDDSGQKLAYVPSQSSRRGRRLDMRSVSPRTVKMSSVYGSLVDCVQGERLHDARRSCSNPVSWMFDTEMNVQTLQPPSPRMMELDALGARLATFMDQTQRRFDLVYGELSAVKSAQIAVMANRARSLSTDEPASRAGSPIHEVCSVRARTLSNVTPTSMGTSPRNVVSTNELPGFHCQDAVQDTRQELQQITRDSQLLPHAHTSNSSSDSGTALREAFAAIEDLRQRLAGAEDRIMEQMDANEQMSKEVETVKTFRNNVQLELSASRRANRELKYSVAYDLLNLARGKVKHKTSLRTSPWISEGDRRSQLTSRRSQPADRRSEFQSASTFGSADGSTPRPSVWVKAASEGSDDSSEFGLKADMAYMSNGAMEDDGDFDDDVNDGDERNGSHLRSTNRSDRFGSASNLIGQDLERLYSLKDTVWDAALLLGLESVGFVANLTLAMSLACNITLQLLFCWIVTYLPDNDEYGGGEEAINTWLATASAADVHGVCDVDQSMSGNYQQYSLFDTAQGYVREFSPGVPYAQGPILCCIVLIAWSLSICVVLREVIDFVSCITLLCSREVNAVVLVSSLQRFHLEAVPVHRMIWAWALGVVQASIAVILLWYGTAWLVTTTEPSELVLNAVALTYVMEIDELIFQTTVPKQVSGIISNLDPMALYSSRREGVPLRALLSVLGIFIFVVTCSTTLLAEHHAKVHAVVSAIDCDSLVR